MRIAVLLSLIYIVTGCSNDVSQETQSLTGTYFEEAPPGMTPKIFAPGIMSTRFHEHSCPIYSPDAKEIFYTLDCDDKHVIIYLQMIDGKWTSPESAPFSGEFSDDKAQFSTDGNRLYFRSKRPLGSSIEPEKEYSDWYVDKVDGNWEKTAILNTTGENNQTLSVTKYVSIMSSGDNPNFDIYIKKYINGKYAEPEKMDNNINTDGVDNFQYISPDESFMLLSSMNRPDMIGRMDLYISFKNSEGKWSKAINMGDKINSPNLVTRFPVFSPDGNYLFYWQDKIGTNKNDRQIDSDLTNYENNLLKFGSWLPENGDDGDIFWVSSKVIEKLRVESLK